MVFISIKTPEVLRSERAKLLKEAVELMRQQARSSVRYAKKINTILSKVETIDKKLGG